MDKVVHFTDLKDKKTDFLFWSKKSYQERLDAVEFLRQQYINFTNASQRLQRVCTIVEKA